MSSKTDMAAILRYLADKVERDEAKMTIDCKLYSEVRAPDPEGIREPRAPEGFRGQTWKISGVTTGKLPDELIHGE